MSVPWPGVFQTRWRAPIHSFLTCAPAVPILKASTTLRAGNKVPVLMAQQPCLWTGLALSLLQLGVQLLRPTNESLDLLTGSAIPNGWCKEG